MGEWLKTAVLKKVFSLRVPPVGRPRALAHKYLIIHPGYLFYSQPIVFGLH
jgi:hypothetical protein